MKLLRKEWLYYLEDRKGIIEKGNRLLLSRSQGALTINLVTSNKSRICLQHYCHGHPPFSFINIIFLLLFENVSIENFHCDLCEFATHHRELFPLSSIKYVEPFSLIHSDVCRPSNIPKVTRAK